MSERRRASYCRPNVKEFRKKEKARFFRSDLSLVLVCFIFSSLTGCALFDKRVHQEEENLLSTITSLCFSGNGKGRMETPKGKYTFRYESILNEKKESWSFAFHFPFGRQEILHLHYSQRAKATGSFYRLVNTSLSNAEKAQVYDVLAFAADLAKSFQKKEASPDLYEQSFPDKKIIAPRLKKKLSLEVSQFDHYYRHLIFKYQDFAAAKPKIVLHLFPSSCKKT